jgi:cell division protein FtsL
MGRWGAILLLVLVGSAVYLVRTSYESRRLFVQLERERARATELAVDDERLQIERRAQATHLRVERVARERLNMRTANAAVTQYVGVGVGELTAPAASGAQP